MLMDMTSTASSDLQLSAQGSRPVPQLTAAGFDRLRDQIARAELSLQDAQDQVRQQMEAKETESLGLVEAQQHLAQLEGHVEELETLLARTVVIRTSERDPQVVTLGDVLTLTEQPSGKVRRVQLVSPDEVTSGNAGVPQVSSASPVGLAVLGVRVGERVTLRVRTRELRYKVTAIGTDI